MVAGMVAQGRERPLHVEVFSFGDHSLGLFDDDPAVECVLEFLVDDLGFEGGAVLDCNPVYRRMAGAKDGVQASVDIVDD